jgi:type II secretory pathway component PulJ
LKTNNGFVLLDALLGLWILSICILLLYQMTAAVQNDARGWIDAEIDEEWFYTD